MTTPTRPTRTWVSLLRGISLGARNRVSMPDLRHALTAVGFAQVRTVSQSGNIVAVCPHSHPDQVAAAVQAVVDQVFGFLTPVIVRAPHERHQVLTWCPFPDAVSAPERLHVLHLDTAPASAAVAAFLQQDWGADRVAHKDRELVISYAASMHASRLQHTDPPSGSARNWGSRVSLPLAW